jgi:predicted membrane channel-forming protein YqfA (hemolysin III family)
LSIHTLTNPKAINNNKMKNQIKKIAGIAIIVFIFGGIIGIHAVEYGILYSLISFIIGIGIAGLLFLAVFLIMGGEED